MKEKLKRNRIHAFARKKIKHFSYMYNSKNKEDNPSGHEML